MSTSKKYITEMQEYVFGALMQVLDNEGLQEKTSSERRASKKTCKEDAQKICNLFLSGEKDKIKVILKNYGM